MSFGTCCASSRSRALETGSYALTRSIDEPTAYASSVAWRTASLAVSEPSVPTTIRSNMPLLSPAGNPEDHMRMSPTWVWMQVAIVVFVLAAMVIAVVKLA